MDYVDKNFKYVRGLIIDDYAEALCDPKGYFDGDVNYFRDWYETMMYLGKSYGIDYGELEKAYEADDTFKTLRELALGYRDFKPFFNSCV